MTIMSIQTVETTPRLPTTPEGARNRYLATYRKYFVGDDEDRERLANEAEAKMIRIGRKARTFYETKFPNFINQATNALLMHDTNTVAGKSKFDQAHRDFLHILDSLMRSQPAGDVTYQQEVERESIIRSYTAEHKRLRQQLMKLEAREFDCDEIGEDEDSSLYFKTVAEIERTQQKLKSVAEILLKMNQEEDEPEEPFRLKVVPRTVLSRLKKEEVESLEEQIILFLEQNSNKKNKMYVHQTIIEDMIGKLKLDSAKFTPQELRDLTKDVLDGYKTFFRERETHRREEFHSILLESKELRPKEGIILTDPDDVTAEVREKLDASHLKRKRKEDEIAESFAREHPELSDNERNVDIIDDAESDGENDNPQLTSLMQTNAHLFKRVKEEPEDDFDDPELYYGASDEEEEPQDVDDDPQPVDDDPDDRLLVEDMSCDEYEHEPMEHRERLAIKNDDIEELGVVAPQAKVEVVTISSDDDDL